jgi:subtilase family serine protease
VTQTSLSPGASREGCLVYRVTPSPGSYRLGITADPLNGVRETREDNNTATLEVNVTPR